MIITPVTCAVIGAVLPFTPLADVLGFTTLPLSFFLILVGMIATYLVLVELAKSRFYAAQAHPHRAPLTHEQRHQRHLALHQTWRDSPRLTGSGSIGSPSRRDGRCTLEWDEPDYR